MRDNASVDISARVDYAVRAMLTLAQSAVEDSAPISVEALAADQQLPRKFLEEIFRDLRCAGLVVSTRGARGGYRLQRPDDEIAIGDIFRAVEGPLAEVRGRRPHETSYDGVAKHLPTLWVAVRASLREVLDGTSLRALRTGDLPSAVTTLIALPDAWESR